MPVQGRPNPIPEDPAIERVAAQLSAAGQSIDIVALTSDADLLAILHDAAGGSRRVLDAATPQQAGELMMAGRVGVIVVDTLATGEDSEAFCEQLRTPISRSRADRRRHDQRPDTARQADHLRRHLSFPAQTGFSAARPPVHRSRHTPAHGGTNFYAGRDGAAATARPDAGDLHRHCRAHHRGDGCSLHFLQGRPAPAGSTASSATCAAISCARSARACAPGAADTETASIGVGRRPQHRLQRMNAAARLRQQELHTTPGVSSRRPAAALSICTVGCLRLTPATPKPRRGWTESRISSSPVLRPRCSKNASMTPRAPSKMRAWSDPTTCAWLS